MFSPSYRSILEAQPRGREVGFAAWGTSTQPPTMGHGFWVKLSASDGSSQLNHLLSSWQPYFLAKLLYCIISTFSHCGLVWNLRPEPAPLSRGLHWEMDFEILRFYRNASLFLGSGPARGRGLALVTITGPFELWTLEAIGARRGICRRGTDACFFKVTFRVSPIPASRNGFWRSQYPIKILCRHFCRHFSLLQFWFWQHLWVTVFSLIMYTHTIIS